MISGATVVLRRKFSASQFWRECVKYKVTVFTYVGEVCRYLVNQPACELDRAHSVRLCIGNGTRANIHAQFTQRFGVKVMEFYGATEGNCILVNNVAKTGGHMLFRGHTLLFRAYNTFYRCRKFFSR